MGIELMPAPNRNEPWNPINMMNVFQGDFGENIDARPCIGNSKDQFKGTPHNTKGNQESC